MVKKIWTYVYSFWHDPRRDVNEAKARKSKAEAKEIFRGRDWGQNVWGRGRGRGPVL